MIAQNHQAGIRIFIFIVAAFAVCSYGGEYFISTSGNDNNDGTIDYPFATITKAITIASAGDTIYLRGGNYPLSATITISKSGAAGTMYYLLAYPGDARPVLDFSSMPEAGANRGIRLSSSYWYIKGLDIYGAGDNGMNISGSYNVIEFCRFYENHDTGLQIGGGGSYNQIINCDSYYNADSSLENADGFAPKLDIGTGNYFYGCRAWQNLDDGYDGYLRPADGILTTYENCWAFKNGYLKNGSAGKGDGNGFKMGGSDNKTLRHNVILINCLAFQNLYKGFDQNSNKGSMTLYNCSAFNNGTYNYSITTTLASGETARLTNCLFYSGSNNLGSFVVQTTNSWQSPFSVSSGDFVSIDPLAAYGPRQADGSLPEITFMHLAAGSDLIDGGTDVGLPFNETAPDLGCFEYGVTDPPPAAPTGLSAQAGDQIVILEWDENTEIDITGYNIYRSTTSDSGHEKLNSVLLSTPNYIDYTVINATPYYYVVTAADTSFNESDFSDEVAATPAIYGDFIINGNVEIDDLAYLCDRWLIEDCQEKANLGIDCRINLYEFSVFANNWMIMPDIPVTTITIQENTTGFCDVDGSIDNNNSGFTGTGFANTDNASGTGIDWSVNILSAGTYTFTWRYANAGATRPGKLIINGSDVLSNISFESTGSWTIWTTVSVDVSLTSGIKTIRLEATTSNGLANIDYIQLTGSNLSASSCQ
ncbi:MAG: Pectate lyase L precursor [Planctomycetes bacterium ADurb.Bin401]|nr:MAG: Pectate lyase L precursor [Planctomycetes bacterium ADurb.Bin401]